MKIGIGIGKACISRVLPSSDQTCAICKMRSIIPDEGRRITNVRRTECQDVRRTKDAC